MGWTPPKAPFHGDSDMRWHGDIFVATGAILGGLAGAGLGVLFALERLDWSVHADPQFEFVAPAVAYGLVSAGIAGAASGLLFLFVHWCSWMGSEDDGWVDSDSDDSDVLLSDED